MSQNETPITIVGNVVNDPEVRFTSSGVAVANFRVASTPRKFNSQTSQWEDGEALFLTCNVWRQAAENVAASLAKGMRIIAHGNLRARTFQTREGENRTVFEVEVDEVGPALKFATAKVTRANRDSGANAAGGQQVGSWGSGPQQGFGQATNDEPPY